MRDFRQDYLVLAAMLVALVLFAGTHQAVWNWLTHDLRDGGWICPLIEPGSATEAATPDMRLVGIEGRFVWAASGLLLLSVMGTIVAVCAYSVLVTLTRWRAAVAVAALLILIVLPLASMLTADPDYRAYTQLSSTAAGCDFADRGGRAFQFSRYLLPILAPYYEPGFEVPLLDGFALFEQLLPALVMVSNVFLVVALLTLAWPSTHWPSDPAPLAARMALFRLLVVLGSTLFTAISLYYLSQYGWFAQVLAASNPEGAAQLRGLQRGVTLFLAASNSLAIVLLFLPPGWILSRHAVTLYQKEISAASPQPRSEWLAEHGLTLLSGPAIRIAVASAPLLVSGGVMLLEKALIGV